MVRRSTCRTGTTARTLASENTATNVFVDPATLLAEKIPAHQPSPVTADVTATPRTITDYN
eukprot:scaffold10057_cov140-Isochrysis_galbana.AAC.1